MAFLRRLVGALVLILSGVGTAGCVAGIIGIWVMCQGLSEKVRRIADRLDTGLQRVSAGNQSVQRALARAQADVAELRRETADLGGDGEKGRRAARALRTLIQQKAGPDIDDLGGRLAGLSDAAVALASLLQSFQEVTPDRSVRFDPEQLQDRAQEVRQVSVTLRRLETLVGDGDLEAGRQEVETATSAVDRVLEQCQAAVDNWQAGLDASREDLARVKGKILSWFTFAAIAVTGLCLWVGAGQVSLFARALQWCKGN